MPFASIRGADIYHEVQGSGPPLLFIPGALVGASTWARVAPMLVDQFTVITYDRRGHTRSNGGTDGQPSSAAEQSDDAVALLEAIGLSPAASMGTARARSWRSIWCYGIQNP